MFDDGTLFGTGNTFTNLGSNPLLLAGLQMVGNNTPRVGQIPNTMEGVPNIMLSASTQNRQEQERQRREQERQRQIAEEAATRNALAQALQNTTDVSPEDAATYARGGSTAIQLLLDKQMRQRNDAEFQKYAPGLLGEVPAPPVPPQQPAPQQQPQQQSAAPQPYQPPEQQDPQQQAIHNAAAQFDKFGLSTTKPEGGFKTVAEVAQSLDNKTEAAKLIQAAKSAGLSPDSPFNSQVLGDPSTAAPLARALGIGTNLSDDEFTQAHGTALQASRDRQAQRAEQQQPQQAPAVQVGPAQGSQQPGVQVGPAQGGMQQPQYGPATQQALAAAALKQQQQAQERAAMLAMGSSDPRTRRLGEIRLQALQKQEAKTPQFTVIDNEGNRGIWDPATRTITPYKPQPSDTNDDGTGTFPGDTIDERLQSVPQEKRNTIKGMIEGRIQPPGSFALKNKEIQHLIDVASRVDPTFDQTKWHERVTEAKAMSSGGKTGQALTSMNTLVEHAGKLDKSIDKLENTNYEWLNAPLQSVKGASGDTKFQAARADFEANRKVVADELVKLLRGGVGAVSDVNDWNEKLRMAKSPTELHQVVDSIMTVMVGRMSPLIDTHNKAFSRDTAVEDYLSPGAKNTLQEIQDRRLKKLEPAAQEAPTAPRGRQGGAAPQGGLPQAGQVVNGYRFRGGDPNSRDSWEPAQ